MDNETKNLVDLITEASKQSKCSACGSSSYGKGCKYGPNGLHLHLDDPVRCSWCGSKTLYGKGCPYSPTGYHGMGSNLYTNMPTESFITSFLLKGLKTPFIETMAYKNGIIDEHGTTIRKPQTLNEKNSFTVLNAFMFKIKKFLGNKLDLVNETLYLDLSKQAINEKCSVEEYEKELLIKRKMENIARQFSEVVAEARNSSVSEAVIEKTILESFGK